MAGSSCIYRNTGDAQQRVAVEAGRAGARLGSNKMLDPMYVAEPGERVEWVVAKGASLYADDDMPIAGIDELEPRGPKG